jgi:anti-sigma factor RsiW
MPHIEEDLLDQYAMGTLPQDSAQHVEEHLLSCTVCQARLKETDEFLAVYSVAAAEMQTRVPWRGIHLAPARAVWASAAVLAAAAALWIAVPRRSSAPPATVWMQSLRGPESQAHVASGKPALLVFDLPVAASATNYEIEVVDPAGNPVLTAPAQLTKGRLSGLLKLASGTYWVRVYHTQPRKELVAEYGLEAGSR